MKHGALKNTRHRAAGTTVSAAGRLAGATVTGATASGATAVGAASLGTMALGAMALGALAVGALAIGRLRIGRARLGRVEIDELAVGRLAIGADAAGPVAAVVRVRTPPGEGEAFARLLRVRMTGSGPAGSLRRVHRSGADPDPDTDTFLFSAASADEAAFARHAEADELDALLREAAGDGLVLAAPDAPAEVALYRRL